MGLKKELTISFGGLTLVMLLAFGVITYYTFSETIRSSRGEVFKLKARETTQSLVAKLSRQEETLRHHIEALFTDYREERISREMLTQQLRSRPIKSGLLESVYFIDPADGRVIAGSGEEDPRVLASMYMRAEEDYPHRRNGVLVREGEGVFLVWHLSLSEKGERRMPVVSRVNSEELLELFTSAMEIEGGSLVVSHQGRFVSQVAKEKGALSDEELDAVLNLDVLSPAGLGETQKHLVFTAEKDFFGWKLSYVMSKSLFYKDLDNLKNRVLAAVVLIWWVTLWAIMIFSHRITNPIRLLSKGCKDIVELNYETPLEVKGTSEEVVALAKAFETMRERIRDQVAKDQLTSVFNRRFLMQVLEKIMSKAKRLDEDLSCLMMDVDFFKKVNDTYGHSGGDEVLKSMGKVLMTSTRDYDIVARYGGEEFTVLLPNTPEDVAYQVAERIRKSMEACVTAHEGKEIRCTVSIGLASLENSPETPGKLLEMADEALYLAKREGRNRTVVYARDCLDA